jgi:RNA polymerase sigma-70 factor (ECF subfamily)
MNCKGRTMAALLQRGAEGNEQAMEGLFSLYRVRLRAIVRLRLNRRLQNRVDPSDVLQEAYVKVCKGLANYIRAPSVPFCLSLGHITGQKLIAVLHQHLGAQMRDANREVSLYRAAIT